MPTNHERVAATTERDQTPPGVADSNNPSLDKHAELNTRLIGVLLIAGGSIGASIICLTALYCRYLHHTVLPYELILFGYGACGIAILAGLRERSTRPHRKAIRHGMAVQQDIIQRMDHIEVTEQRIAETFEALAESLPEGIERRWWKGFNSAVNRGLLDTGTEGTPVNRGSHLDLVRSDHN